MESSALESRLGTPSPPPCCADLAPPSPLFLRIQTPLGIRTRLSRRRRSTTSVSVSFSAFLLMSDFDFVLFCHLFSFWFLRMRSASAHERIPCREAGQTNFNQSYVEIFVPRFTCQENYKNLYKQSVPIIIHVVPFKK